MAFQLGHGQRKLPRLGAEQRQHGYAALGRQLQVGQQFMPHGVAAVDGPGRQRGRLPLHGHHLAKGGKARRRQGFGGQDQVGHACS